jgi:hypothetical protein
MFKKSRVKNINRQLLNNGRRPIMLSLNQCIVPNRSEITSKVMDGEAIMINLATGIYYSMDKVGGTIWEGVEQGQRLDQIVQNVVATYEVSVDQAAKDLECLVGQLREENLIILQESGESLPLNVEGQATSPVPYESPVLNSYRDMGDLLALDPPMPGMAETPWQTSEAEATSKPNL